MAQCVKCGAKGMFLAVNRLGLCQNCSANEIENLINQNQILQSQLSQFQAPEYQDLVFVQNKIQELKNNLSVITNQYNEECKLLEREKIRTKHEIDSRNAQIVELDEKILLQEFGLYKPTYDFANSEQYKYRLEDIRNLQKQMIKEKTAVSYYEGWTVDGSAAKGRKMTNDNIKQILRTFNLECENAIDHVKFNNIESMKKRIEKSFESLNKLNDTNRISITGTYKELKLQELNLAIEYQMKKQEEKEEQKRIREELREQAKLEKELQEARKNIDKEQKHYQMALSKLNKQLETEQDERIKQELLNKQKELEGKLSELDQAMKDVDYRAANQKAGYVYIISNIGSFGENIYKIGMTRRLDPMERVYELGDASVPFNFDVHAMIFTEDAPALENALHKAFEDKKVNMINTRREFFNVTLEEIEEVVKNNFDKTVEFVEIPEAEQYRQSIKIKEAI